MILRKWGKRVLAYGVSNWTFCKTVWKSHGGQKYQPSNPSLVVSKTFSMKHFRAVVPVTVGVSLLGVLQWVYFKRRVFPQDESAEIVPASRWEVTVYTLLPLRIMSRVWGTLTSIDLPVFLRPKVYSLYAKSFSVNLDECKNQDLASYRSLSEFFIRPLREECRPIDCCATSLVSPADGRILTFGKISSCQVDQVKGVTYSLQQFLGEPTWKEEGTKKLNYLKTDKDFASSNLSNEAYLKVLKNNCDNDLYQCVIYLAPGDYHRFHSPVSWRVTFRRHFQGKLLSVNPAIASWIRDLFALNERAAYIGFWKHGFFSLTAVGATNVGSIKVIFDPSLHTNRWIVRPRHRDLHFNSNNFKKNGQGVSMDKGELFGEFRLGSTIVLIFEAPKNFQFRVKSGQKIKYGERLGET